MTLKENNGSNKWGIKKEQHTKKSRSITEKPDKIKGS